MYDLISASWRNVGGAAQCFVISQPYDIDNQ